MSIRRAAPALVTAALAVLVVGLTPSAAGADPRAMDRDPCTVLLAQAAHWPGSGPDGRRLYSDAYLSYLLRQPECAGTGS